MLRRRLSRHAFGFFAQQESTEKVFGIGAVRLPRRRCEVDVTCDDLQHNIVFRFERLLLFRRKVRHPSRRQLIEHRPHAPHVCRQAKTRVKDLRRPIHGGAHTKGTAPLPYSQQDVVQRRAIDRLPIRILQPKSTALSHPDRSAIGSWANRQASCSDRITKFAALISPCRIARS